MAADEVSALFLVRNVPVANGLHVMVSPRAVMALPAEQAAG